MQDGYYADGGAYILNLSTAEIVPVPEVRTSDGTVLLSALPLLEQGQSISGALLGPEEMAGQAVEICISRFDLSLGLNTSLALGGMDNVSPACLLRQDLAAGSSFTMPGIKAGAYQIWAQDSNHTSVLSSTPLLVVAGSLNVEAPDEIPAGDILMVQVELANFTQKASSANTISPANTTSITSANNTTSAMNTTSANIAANSTIAASTANDTSVTRAISAANATNANASDDTKKASSANASKPKAVFYYGAVLIPEEDYLNASITIEDDASGPARLNITMEDTTAELPTTLSRSALNGLLPIMPASSAMAVQESKEESIELVLITDEGWNPGEYALFTAAYSSRGGLVGINQRSIYISPV